MTRTAIRLAALLLAAGIAGAAAAVPEDAYLEGYIAAVIERDLGLEVASVEVREGVAYVVVKDLGEQPAERIAAAISHLEGIERVEVSDLDGNGEPARRAEETADRSLETDAFEVLPRVELFEPLIADQRQPHFSAAYQWYLDDPELTRVGSANFGETLALFGGEALGGRWELGMLAGVFSIFDMDADSYDLINSDFWVGPTLSARTDGLSAQLRVYHQSSHLGDEFVLRNRATRVNLSYEGVDLLVSGDPWPWLRIYAGAGYIFHDEPDLQPLSAQGGVELKSPWAFLDDVVRPIAAFDYQSREENHWHEELSLAGGIQFENPEISKLRVQILATWFKGHSPNGQFWERRIETIGIGAHFHF
jgi:Protein of unknown function (DUF1207)